MGMLMRMGRETRLALVRMERMDSRGMVGIRNSSNKNSNNHSISSTNKVEGDMLVIPGMLLNPPFSRLRRKLGLGLGRRCLMRWLGFLRSRRWVFVSCRILFSVSVELLFAYLRFSKSALFFVSSLSLELGDNKTCF